VKIEWSWFAVEDRASIFDYIEQDDPRAVIAVDERMDSDFRRNDLKMLCIVNKVIPAKAGAFRYPGAVARRY
jgi:plasmid stabilization system protein ParE